MYRCEICKRMGKDFAVPIDKIGTELMEAHLQEHTRKGES